MKTWTLLAAKATLLGSANAGKAIGTLEEGIKYYSGPATFNHWNEDKKNSALLPSGLLGPVAIQATE